MLKVHHGRQSYAEASSDAARIMKAKLEKQIEKGRQEGLPAIDRIMNERPQDQILAANVIEFEVSDEDQVLVNYQVGQTDFSRTIHNHALGQMTEQVHLPKLYFNHLLEKGDWGRKLLAENLTKLYRHADSRHLIRSVDNEIRGFLSTKYQRRDPGEMLTAFIEACGRVKAVPYEAYHGATKFMVKAVLDHMIEPIRDEVIALGVVIHESPYGNGATEISPFIERMWCTNKAITTTSLRKVHIGGRLSDNIEWSDETYRKDTDAMCSQITDLVVGQLGDKAIRKLTDTVIQANEESVDPDKFESFLKKELGRNDAQVVIDKFTSADIQNLPQGNNLWRASNALSWFAGTLKDPEKVYEVQRLAGQVLPQADA